MFDSMWLFLLHKLLSIECTHNLLLPVSLTTTLIKGPKACLAMLAYKINHDQSSAIVNWNTCT